MNLITESEVKVSEPRITNTRIRSDSTAKLTAEVRISENKKDTIRNKKTTHEITTKKLKVDSDMLKLVEASKLSLDDKFMQYESKEGTNEARIKKWLTRIIQSGNIDDFYRPKMDPSFAGNSICYVAGKMPAVGKSKIWWKRAAKRVGLQLGTEKQYIAFIGCLIKDLVEAGWDVTEAWYAVCSDSKSLGHFYNSEGAKCDLEMTGSREVCGFYDLGNTQKILEEDEGYCLFYDIDSTCELWPKCKADEADEEDACWIAGGNYFDRSDLSPLSFLIHDHTVFNGDFFSVGWLVLNINPYQC